MVKHKRRGRMHGRGPHAAQSGAEIQEEVTLSHSGSMASGVDGAASGQLPSNHDVKNVELNPCA